MLSVLLLMITASWAQAQSKYATTTLPLSVEHSYFQKNPAPDYWRLAGFYHAQDTDAACGIASASMVLNAIRGSQALTSEDELVRPTTILEKSGNTEWGSRVMMGNKIDPKGPKGTSLELLAKYLQEAAPKFSVSLESVQAVHVAKAASPELVELRRVLTANEKSSTDFLIVNFDQKFATGDSSVGHLAPVGAYDAKNHRVLIMDPDRKWYEPYWISDETLLQAMATSDSESGKNRGYLWIKVSKPKK